MNWLNGKKTYIGIIGLALVGGLEKAGLVPPGTGDQIASLFKLLIGIGVAHKADKMIAATTTATGGGGTGDGK